MIVASVPPRPKHAGPGAAPTLSGPTVIAPSATRITELPPTPWLVIAASSKDVGTRSIRPRRSTRTAPSATTPMSEVVPPTSSMRTCLNP